MNLIDKAIQTGERTSGDGSLTVAFFISSLS